MSIGNKTTFWKLISDNNLRNITIPQIQRDYVQGRNNDKVNYSRRRILEDIKNAIIKLSEIDLNFVYGKEDNALFVPIDGQQRLTTLLTLHIYAFGKDKYDSGLNLLKSKFIYRTRITTQRFIENLIENIKYYFDDENYSNVKDFILDSPWYSQVWERDPSVASFLVVLEEIDTGFKDINNLTNILINDNCPLTFMSLKIDDVGRVNDLYIKMNSRGKSLTNFENFKSCLYEYIDKSTFDKKEEFKSKMDNLWMSFVWELVYDPMKNCDNRFMILIDLIIKNRLLAYKDTNRYDDNKWTQLFKSNSFYNFTYYEIFLNNNVLTDLYNTFDFLVFYTNFENQFSIEPWLKNLLISDYNPGHKEKVKLAAITKYAISRDRTNWNVSEFNDWHRILENLINNTPIDVDYRTQAALKAIYSIDHRYSVNPTQKFADDFNISFFDDSQKDEEKLKCKLICGNPNWKSIFVEAESFPYFNGCINFALRLSSIVDDSPSSLSTTKLAEFNQKWEYIKLIFNSNYTEHIIGTDNVFRRALLTFGDYSIEANSSKTYFFEGKKDYFNWRRLLKENTSFNIFKSFFNDLIMNATPNDTSIIDRMNYYISNYNNRTNEFIYHLIKMPQLFAFMDSKKYNFDLINNNRIILYSSATLQAKYAEAYTYIAFLKYGSNNKKYTFGQGRLDSSESKAYISEVNGNSCHIEFNRMVNCFYDQDGNPLTYNGINITDIDTLVQYMASL